MAVTEKRIGNIEKTLIRHDEQIAKLFSEVVEVKQIVTFSKGMLKGALAILIFLGIADLGLLDSLRM
tara:strand:- start:119 stop:319 length:201 start_codon:yes stop_codon:yes gene_type:complete